MTTARHASPVRHRPLVRAVLAGVACASAAGIIAGLASVAAGPATLPVPQAQSHAPARSAHRAVVARPGAHKAVQRRVAVYVTVRHGQCLWTIAAAHHVSEGALYRANRSTVARWELRHGITTVSDHWIYAGMRLRIPAPRSNR